MKLAWEAKGVVALHWWPVSPREAAELCDAGLEVRQVWEFDRAVRFAHLTMGVTPYFIRGSCKKPFIVQARALVCICLACTGWTEREIADELGMAHSSVHDLIKKHSDDRDVREALARCRVYSEPAGPCSDSRGAKFLKEAV